VLTIDGSSGEGGGQILRTALGLSIVTGTPFRIERIRARREKPGLLRQHLTAVEAAAEISRARVEGAALRSTALTFEPGPVRPGEYTFNVGTAGSATLVLQTILPPLLTASSPSLLVLEGGTHNPAAPPFDFIARSFLPLLQRMGPEVAAELERPGFVPAGGGRFHVAITPVSHLRPFSLIERGPVLDRRARALVSRLPRSIGEREIRVLRDALSLAPERASVDEIHDGIGPGNVVLVDIELEHHTEVFTGFGRIGVRAEAIANRLVDEVQEYLAGDHPVGRCLADQLLVPFALAGAGRFRTGPLSLHATTNVNVVKQFLDVEIDLVEEATRTRMVEVRSRRGRA
jgi:RNA 3'-terminal phosphate cyclase (ATP)